MCSTFSWAEVAKKSLDKMPAFPNQCFIDATGSEQQFLLYLAGHWFEHVLISPLIYIHLDASGILKKPREKGC